MKGIMQVTNLPFYMKIPLLMFKGRVRQSLYMQGLGRHSIPDLHGFMKSDMEALSIFLGKCSY